MPATASQAAALAEPRRGHQCHRDYMTTLLKVYSKLHCGMLPRQVTTGHVRRVGGSGEDSFLAAAGVTPPMRDVVVVGAGVSGLAVATALQERGLAPGRVQVLDAAPRAGGFLRSDSEGGWLVEGAA
ncbi:MAG TPA: FAD-dependent oxidoreductase, partial [Candidatus Thermoplasmatota archaeon]|nr:FAD-dependent oxidoreductase [Candidatus Thermoplasmatota archaeon]